jgi:hypothetical protein
LLVPGDLPDAGLSVGHTIQAYEGKAFVGDIDEVRVSVGERYTTDFSISLPETKRPLAIDGATALLFHFDDEAGGKTFDSSGNARHGKLNGSATIAARCPPP